MKKKVFEEGKTYTYEEIEEILRYAIGDVTNIISKKTEGSRKMFKDKEIRNFKRTLDDMKIMCELSIYEMYVLGQNVK